MTLVAIASRTSPHVVNGRDCIDAPLGNTFRKLCNPSSNCMELMTVTCDPYSETRGLPRFPPGRAPMTTLLSLFPWLLICLGKSSTSKAPCLSISSFSNEEIRLQRTSGYAASDWVRKETQPSTTVGVRRYMLFVAKHANCQTCQHLWQNRSPCHWPSMCTVVKTKWTQVRNHWKRVIEMVMFSKLNCLKDSLCRLQLTIQ